MAALASQHVGGIPGSPISCGLQARVLKVFSSVSSSRRQESWSHRVGDLREMQLNDQSMVFRGLPFQGLTSCSSSVPEAKCADFDPTGRCQLPKLAIKSNRACGSNGVPLP